MHETVLQKALRNAVNKARVPKRITCHTFRHSFASHLLQANYDIHTIQEMLRQRQLDFVARFNCRWGDARAQRRTHDDDLYSYSQEQDIEGAAQGCDQKCGELSGVELAFWILDQCSA